MTCTDFKASFARGSLGLSATPADQCRQLGHFSSRRAPADQQPCALPREDPGLPTVSDGSDSTASRCRRALRAADMTTASRDAAAQPYVASPLSALHHYHPTNQQQAGESTCRGESTGFRPKPTVWWRSSILQPRRHLQADRVELGRCRVARISCSVTKPRDGSRKH